jgi:hypothetical protein
MQMTKKRKWKMENRGWRLTILALGLFILTTGFCLSAMAQQYSIAWSKIAGGGGTSTSASTNGAYQVTGTIGQPDAGVTMTGGSYALTGGFWSLIAVVQTPGAPQLAISANPLSSTITISWPVSAGNYVLEENSNLVTGTWAPAGLSVSTNGTTLSVTFSPGAGNLFFRLKQ